MVLPFLSTYEGVEIKTDGEPSIVEIDRRVQARRDKTTTLAQTSVGCHQEIGAVERAHGTVQAQLRAYYLDVQERMKVRIIPGTQLFTWMLRHSVWTVVRYQSDQRSKQTPYERTRGCRYESALVSFEEVVMAKIADADKMRAGKLDSAWVKAVWVGRVDKSNEHLLLTKGCIRSRVVRCIPDDNQSTYDAEVGMLQSGRVNRQGHRGDGPERAGLQHKRGQRRRRDKGRLVTIPCQANSDDHLRQPTTETDVIEQNIVMDSGTARVSDDGANQGVLRMDQEEGVAAEEQARRRLRSKQPARRSLTDDETVSNRLKREVTIAAIKKEILKTASERPDLEQAHKFYANESGQ